MNTYFTQNRRQSSFSVEQQMNDNSSEAAAASSGSEQQQQNYMRLFWVPILTHNCWNCMNAFFTLLLSVSRFKRADFLEMVKNLFFFFGAGNDNGIRLIFAEVTDK